jgi:hypothetical protein
LIETVARFPRRAAAGRPADARFSSAASSISATAQASRPDAPVDRLIVRCRRAAGRTSRSNAISTRPCQTLEPLLLTLGHRQAQSSANDLFQTVARLPDGRVTPSSTPTCCTSCPPTCRVASDE